MTAAGGRREAGKPVPTTARQVLEAYNRTRGPLPGARSVHVRPNRSRLASITGGGSDVRLNVAKAVVEAGPRAWALLGPALQGDREAVRRIAALARQGIQKARARAREGRGLPNPRCEGSAGERRILAAILQWARATRGVPDPLSENLQVRVSRRMTRTFGTHRTRGGAHRITISRRLFKPGIEDILLDTVLHELAHLLDARTNGSDRSSHGSGWKAWCRRLGARPQRLAGPEDVRRVEAAQKATGAGRMPEPVAAWIAAGRPSG